MCSRETYSRWPLAAGRWPLAAGRWPLAAGGVGRADLAYERRADLLRVLSSHADVVMVGDSLTAEGEWSELLGPGVVDRGIGKDTTARLLRRLDTLPPSDVAFLMIGTNDIIQGVPLAETEERTQRIVRALERPVFLQSVPHLAETDRDLNREIDDLNARNRAFCETGVCTFIDLQPAIEGGLSPDGVHLSGRAYLRWAALIRPLAVQAVASRNSLAVP